MKAKFRIQALVPLLVAAALAFTAARPSSASDAEQDRQFVADTREYLGRLEKLGFSGVVLVAVAGDPVLAQGYGLADREHAIPWSPGTISCTGSITKQFTAAAILKLEEEGKLRVMDPITQYFSGVPPDKTRITLHQLLTHTSGIEDLDGRDDYDPIGREDFVRLALAQPLSAPPGTHYSYSNAGFSLLGIIIERLSGVSYEEFLRRRFFVPLGMYETGYKLPAWGEARLAMGYQGGTLWGTILGRPMDVDGPYWVLRANGGIHSSSYDMLRWARALMEGRVLKPESMAKLWTPFVPEGGDSFYGYGWSIRTLPGDVKVITHNGSNGIFFADFALIPKVNLVIFLQSNIVADMPAAQTLLESIGFRFLAARPYPRVPKVVDAPESGLAPLEGIYHMAGNDGVFRVKRDGKALALEADGPAAFTVLHSVQALDPGRREELGRRLDKAVTAARTGDFRPLFEAYGGKAPLDLLKSHWQEFIEQAEKENGRLRKHEILGTARTAERDETVVRLVFENGTVERTYVWSFEEKPLVQGVSVRGLKTRLPFLPESATEFASWDGGFRPSKPLRFERDAGGRLRLRLGAGDQSVEAVRK